MNIPPSEAQGIDLEGYEALLFNWNEMHDIDRADAPDAEEAMRVLAAANADSRLIN